MVAMWFIGLMMFTASGYISTPTFPGFHSEQECRDGAAKLGLPEMPPAVLPSGLPNPNLPNKGWVCIGPK